MALVKKGVNAPCRLWVSDLLIGKATGGPTLPVLGHTLGQICGVFISPGVTFEPRGGQRGAGINSAALFRRRSQPALHAVPAECCDSNGKEMWNKSHRGAAVN